MNGLLGLAFAAGMLAPVNPCGFALLPAWITHTLGGADTSPLPVRLLRALRAGAALTLGFAGTLAVAGLAVSAGARALIGVAPWLGAATGVVLLLLGAVMLTGRHPRLRLPAIPSTVVSGTPTAARLGVFGVGYAAASLSCTFGVLLAVIAQAQATANLPGLLAVFAAYATGSATVLLLVSTATTAAGAALTRRVTALARHGTTITAVVLMLTGTYLAWYWLPTATHGTTTARSNALAGFSATASTWIGAHTSAIAALATAVLTVAAAAGRHQLRQPGQTTAPADADPNCCPPDDDTDSAGTDSAGTDSGGIGVRAPEQAGQESRG